MHFKKFILFTLLHGSHVGVPKRRNFSSAEISSFLVAKFPIVWNTNMEAKWRGMIFVPKAPVSFGHVGGKTGRATRYDILERVALGTRMKGASLWRCPLIFEMTSEFNIQIINSLLHSSNDSWVQYWNIQFINVILRGTLHLVWL